MTNDTHHYPERTEKLLKEVANGNNISDVYNGMSLEDQRAIFALMRGSNDKIPGLHDLVITGIDDNKDGKADRLGDVYHMPTGRDLFNQKGESSDSLDAKFARAEYRKEQKDPEYRLTAQPDNIYVTQGDNLSNIARKHLEANPVNQKISEQDVNQHVQDIAKANHIKTDSTLAAGSRLTLPGYNGEGAVLTFDETLNGGNTVRWPESAQFTSSNNESIAIRDKNGKIETSIPEEAMCIKENAIELDDARKHLSNIAEERLNKTDLEHFKTDLKNFESGVTCGDFSAEQAKQTYEEVERLLTAEQGAVSQPERILLAQNIMHHAAQPTSIDQGKYKTCTTTAASELIYLTRPELAAKMAADTALTGQWTTPDGKTIKIDKESLIPTPESRVNPPLDGDRSYATQVLNLVMSNEITQRREPPEYYYQSEKRSNAADSGERLLNADGKPVLDEKGKAMDSPNISVGDLEAQASRLGEGKPFYYTAVLAEDLQQNLKEGKTPIIVRVNPESPQLTGLPDKNSDSGHAVSISRYDPHTEMVRLSNQWGSENDRWVSVDKLKSSMYPSETDK
jgi:hypothetical protein